jgi:hypothetical protein
MCHALAYLSPFDVIQYKDFYDSVPFQISNNFVLVAGGRDLTSSRYAADELTYNFPECRF